MSDLADSNYYGHARREIVKYVPRHVTTMLDVGCASGEFGRAIMEARPGLSVWGIELDPEAARTAREGNYRAVICGAYPDDAGGLDDRVFDCIVFNDVLEHMVSPELALADARSRLAVGGVVVASIPNVRNWTVLRDLVVRGRWTYVDAGILDRTHLRFYTRSSVLDLFGTAGYDVTCLEGINHEVSSSTRMTRLLARSAAIRTEFLALQYLVVASCR